MKGAFTLFAAGVGLAGAGAYGYYQAVEAGSGFQQPHDALPVPLQEFLTKLGYAVLPVLFGMQGALGLGIVGAAVETGYTVIKDYFCPTSKSDENTPIYSS